MRFDLSPPIVQTVGFDSLASTLDQVASFDKEADTYPPYNIERLPKTSIASPWQSPASARKTSRLR